MAGNYAADYTAITPRLGGRTLLAAAASPTSTVTQEMVAAWITEAEAMLDAELDAIGLTVPITGTNPIAICKAKVVSQVAARVISSWEVGTRLEDSPAATALMKEWDDFLALIQSKPDKVASMLGQAKASGAGTFRSHIVSNSHSKTVADGDFDPKFTKDMDN